MSIQGSGGSIGGGDGAGALSTNGSVSRWKVFCYDEPAPLDEPNAPGDWVEGWWPTKPDFCFNNRNHRINERSVQWIETITEQGPIKIQEEDVPPGRKPGGGHIRATAPLFKRDDAEEGDYTIVPGENTMTIVRPYVFYIYGVQTNTIMDQLGDKFEVLVAPNTAVGFLVADVEEGDTTLYVSSTVLEHAFTGVRVALNNVGPPDGSVEGTSLGEIYDVDKAEGTIKVTLPAPKAFSATTPPTFVQITAHPITEFYIGYPGNMSIGGFKTGGTRVEPGMKTVLKYWRNSDSVLPLLPIPMEMTV